MDLKATLHNLTSCSQTPIEAVSISVPGAVDSDQGIIGGYSAIPYIHKIHFVSPQGSERNDNNMKHSIDYYIHPLHDQKRMRFILI